MKYQFDNTPGLHTCFGGQTIKWFFVQAKTSMLDVLKELVFVSKIQPNRYGELPMAMKQSTARSDMLIDFDRGFF